MKVQQKKTKKKIIRYMKTKMEMCGVTMPASKNNANIKITATDQYLTFCDGESGKVIGKIENGEGYICEYNLPTNVTKVYKSLYSVYDEIKIDISEPYFVINGDLYDFMMDFRYENKNVKIVKTPCEIYSESGYIGNNTCSVYCGN